MTMYNLNHLKNEKSLNPCFSGTNRDSIEEKHVSFLSGS